MAKYLKTEKRTRKKLYIVNWGGLLDFFVYGTSSEIAKYAESQGQEIMSIRVMGLTGNLDILNDNGELVNGPD